MAQINTEIIWKSDLEMLKEPLIESHIRLKSTVKLWNHLFINWLKELILKHLKIQIFFGTIMLRFLSIMPCVQFLSILAV